MRPVWLDRHLWQIQPVRDILAIFAIIGLFWLGSKLSIVTVPLLLALLLAYLLEPVIQWVMRRTELQRRGAVSAILAAFVFVVVLPAALGLTYGVIQGVGLAITGARNVDLLSRSVALDLRVAEMERQLREAAERAEAAEQSADAQPAESQSPAAAAPQDPPQPPVDAVTDPADLAAGAAPPQDGEAAGEAEAPGEEDLPTPESLAKARRDAREARDTLRDEAGDSWVEIHEFITRAGKRTDIVTFLEGVSGWLQREPGAVAITAAGVGMNAAEALLRFSIRAFGIAFGAFLTAFFFYFMATEWVKVQHFATRLIPERNKERALYLAEKFDRAISAFIRGRLTIAFIQAIIFSVGYFIIGVPAAFILGPAVALLSIVPYLALIGVPISITLLWLENHTGVRGSILWVLAAPMVIYFIGQALDDYVLTPAIQGKSTDMSTPAILFASLAGGALFGVFGLLIAIPIAACLKIVIQEVLWPRFREWAEGRSKDFLPIRSE